METCVYHQSRKSFSSPKSPSIIIKVKKKKPPERILGRILPQLVGSPSLPLTPAANGSEGSAPHRQWEARSRAVPFCAERVRLEGAFLGESEKIYVHMGWANPQSNAGFQHTAMQFSTGREESLDFTPYSTLRNSKKTGLAFLCSRAIPT
ncbi:hypothetical protein CEXT_370181 [Caerostris extrusa]|uniref:Uncharacterized protein n=1 Tax=Caerostris extrusa TaxID=172846 RepID=A0AAV4NFX9_CAEEX|nr:hypothetical protein CEXT_370181 [Caerostris extrusa]